MENQNWTTGNIPDQKGRIIVVTGASSGIGFETAKALAEKNARVIIAVRNEGKGRNAVQKLKNENDNVQAEFMLIDLADLESVKGFAEKFKAKFDQLDLLINNAGVMIPPYSRTKDEFELQFGTNHLGHFALTGLLLDVIQKTNNSRIVNVSSSAHRYGNINFDDLNWGKRSYRKWRAYGDSKIANLYFTYELQRKFEQSGVDIIAAAAHPGITMTDLQRHSKIIEFFSGFVAMKSKQGALPTLRAAVDESARSGDYFGPDGFQQMRGFPIKVRSNKLSYNIEIAKKLWDVSEKLTGVTYKF
ncbi:MAG: SDR family NAD(P)-dependent oxidoreductase [Calditrichaceae bacterium]|nr:SDR family NAD(P)-dependent oxidoreductase [Calditrichaceae bacterium]HES59402.1 SDR family NAD(P)-dependent oxidoreductase [Caldithrix sp.]